MTPDNLAWFLVGVVTTTLVVVGAVETALWKKGSLPASVARPWTAIKSMYFEGSYDYKIEEPRTTSDISEHLAVVMRAQIRDEDAGKVVIGPGDYTVRMHAKFHFTKRN